MFEGENKHSDSWLRLPSVLVEYYNYKYWVELYYFNNYKLVLDLLIVLLLQLV